MKQPEKPILDYALPARPRHRRDSLEYYREPPPMVNLSVRSLLVWVIAFFVVGIPIVLGLMRYLSNPPL
jgi:hypothetical protein